MHSLPFEFPLQEITLQNLRTKDKLRIVIIVASSPPQQPGSRSRDATQQAQVSAAHSQGEQDQTPKPHQQRNRNDDATAVQQESEHRTAKDDNSSLCPKRISHKQT